MNIFVWNDRHQNRTLRATNARLMDLNGHGGAGALGGGGWSGSGATIFAGHGDGSPNLGRREPPRLGGGGGGGGGSIGSPGAGLFASSPSPSPPVAEARRRGVGGIFADLAPSPGDHIRAAGARASPRTGWE
jgi:hypothetical protein